MRQVTLLGLLLIAACKDTVAPLVVPPPVPVVFRYLDAGSYHACGISTTEQLWCWGYNGDGQLGLSNTVPYLSPQLIPGDFRYRSVTGGQYHACGLTLAGNPWCWGNNADGRLGNGSAAGQSAIPVMVLTAAKVDTTATDTAVVGQIQPTLQAVQAGRVHTCGLDLSQHVWCWGYNGEGELGDGRGGPGAFFANAGLVPTPIAFKVIAVGGLHTCGITTVGAALCWGYNVSGELGDGSTTTSDSPVAVIGGLIFRTDPAVIFPSPDPDFPLPVGPFLSAGYDHTCGIATSGTTFCWGLNQDGQLGTGDRNLSLTPASVPGSFVAVTAGLRHTCALTTAGIASCWGDNTFGQLGDGTTTGRLVPTLVFGGITFAYLKAGDLFTCGVTTAGEAFCWGDNEFGQLGVGSTLPSTVPVRVAAFLAGY